jgi:predicted nucleic acid-binding Zn ribbon protein
MDYHEWLRKLRGQNPDEAPEVRITLVSRQRFCENCGKAVEQREQLCPDCIFMRRVMFQRARYQAGAMDEFAALPPIEQSKRPDIPAGVGSLDDWNPVSIHMAVNRD